MKQQETIWLLTFLAIVSWSSAHIGGSHVGFQRVDPQVYCGRNLANMLAQLCEEVNKRSDDGMLFNKILTPYNKERDIVWPWIAHHKSRALGLSWRGKRHEDDGGIVKECCENACSTDELLQYC